MDRRIRVLGLFLVLCFGLLFLELNNLQIVRASRLLSNPTAQAEQAPPNPFSLPRGDIVTADGVVIADSTPSNDAIGEQRSYPQGPLYAEITGYYDAIDVAATGVEGQYNLNLEQHESQSGTLRELLTQQTGTDSVVLTIKSGLQKVAEQALAGRQGAIIALNPQNGDIYAMYGNPTFDPNDFSSHDPKTVKAAYANDYQNYANNSNSIGAPLTNQVTARTYYPGSTMKVITTAAMYDHDQSLVTKVWPYETSTLLPDTNTPLHNFGGESCGGPLLQILTVSCDTAYAQAGVAIGAANLAAESESFGYNKVPPIDLAIGGSTQAVAPYFPPLKDIETNGQSNVYTGYSAIGQFGPQTSVLGNALVVAGIANGGAIMAPHVMAAVVDNTGKIVSKYQPHIWLQATSPATASAVRTGMLNVVSAGTAKGLFNPADNVMAKTGTAETAGNCSANWLVAAGPAGPNQTPRVAVAAVVPSSGSSCGSESTGATVAGPAVAQLLNAVLAATK